MTWFHARTAILSLLWLSGLMHDVSARSLGIGVYVGNSPAELAQFERWLGRPVDHVAAHTGRANWRDWVGSIKWSVNLWAPVHKPVAWTIPLFVLGGNLSDAAAGKYDDFYRAGAQSIAHSWLNNETIYVRTGEEFNGTWMPWSAAGHAPEFVAAYRRFVEAFRSVSGKFRFEWNVNFGDTQMDLAEAYPGDQYVDVIGMDFYYNIAWHSRDPDVAWRDMVSRPYGLDWLERFASAHRKPTAYPEWGVNSDTAGPFISKAAEWFASHHVIYQRYWNSNSEFAGKLSEGQHPNAGAAYIAAFGPDNHLTDPKARQRPE